MKGTCSAAIGATLLAGCGLLQSQAVICEGVSSADCQAVHREAITHGLFLDGGERVVTAIVRRTESQVCNDGDEPMFDVSFELRGRSEPLVIAVGQTAAGRLTVCTY